MSRWFTMIAIAGVCAAAVSLACKPSTRGGQMDCDAGFTYDSRNFEGGVSVSKYSAEFASSVEAVREVDEMVERFAGRWMALCREYNAGAVDKEAFAQRSSQLTQKMERLDELYLLLKNAPDAAAYQHALRQAYATVVPDKAVDLGVDLTVFAQRPGDAGFVVAAT